jgi:hypothetical protein
MGSFSQIIPLVILREVEGSLLAHTIDGLNEFSREFTDTAAQGECLDTLGTDLMYRDPSTARVHSQEGE